MRKLLCAVIIVVFISSGLSSLEACNSAARAGAVTVVTPPPQPSMFVTQTEPSTRLHNSLLTDSPKEWWTANRNMVMTAFYDENKQVQRPVLANIPEAAITDLGFSASQFNFETGGDYREYIEFFQISAKQLAAGAPTVTLSGRTYNANIAERTVAAKISRNADNYKNADNTSLSLEQVRKDFPAALHYDIPSAHDEIFNALVADLDQLALTSLALERHKMNLVYEKFPEKVITDCLFNIVYLNDKTLDALPKFNWDYFYQGFDRKNWLNAARESVEILKEIGPAALPYIERLYVELNGYQYPADGKRPNANNFGGIGDNPFAGLERLSDQRKTGPLAMTSDAQNNAYIDKTVSRIGRDEQLLPLFLNFMTVFNGKYNTPFYRNVDAIDHVKQLYVDILKESKEQAAKAVTR